MKFLILGDGPSTEYIVTDMSEWVEYLHTDEATNLQRERNQLRSNFDATFAADCPKCKAVSGTYCVEPRNRFRIAANTCDERIHKALS